MKVVDLFCGCGGFSHGMRKAGYSIVGAFDVKPEALAVHAANNPAVGPTPMPKWMAHRYRKRREFMHADLGNLLRWVPEISHLKPDVIVGGPPCQPFSPFGRRGGDNDEKSLLSLAFAIITTSVHPRFFVMENVPELQKTETFRKVTDLFRTSGYGLTERVVTTSDYGSPQKRNRLILAGCVGETDGWLNEYLDQTRHEHKPVIRDVLGEGFGPLFFRRGHYAGQRRSFFRTDEHCPTITSTTGRGTRAPYVLRPADIRVLRSVGEGIAVLGRGPDYVPQAGDTIPARNLPVGGQKELALLASFPANWKWQTEGGRAPTKADVMQMIGNAVPPTLSEALGESLRLYRIGKMEETPDVPDSIHPLFYEWLRDNKAFDETRIESLRRHGARARALVAPRALSTPEQELKAFDQIVKMRPLIASDPDQAAMRESLYLAYDWSLALEGRPPEDSFFDDHERESADEEYVNPPPRFSRLLCASARA
ncbi:DNA cytosine methyltransferase [Mesorhizobium sp. CAU 1732]|uniref:DNA cytosine methyltransferase n=1 Tax=Mesorhizobium sp. CAU 1732 TaxID=3140358 RepID=UPI00326045CE